MRSSTGAWRWKTERAGDKWRGIAALDPQDGDHSPIFASGLMDTEHAALDQAIQHAIDYRNWRRDATGKYLG